MSGNPNIKWYACPCGAMVRQDAQEDLITAWQDEHWDCEGDWYNFEEVIGWIAAIAAGVVVVTYAFWTAWRRKLATIS